MQEQGRAGRWEGYMHMVQKGARILGISLKHYKVPGSHAKYLQVLRIFCKLGGRVDAAPTYLGLAIPTLHTGYGHGLAALPPVWCRAPLSGLV